MDKTQIKYKPNGLNNNSVQNQSVINTSKSGSYEGLISSKIILKRYFVHKNDGVSFGELLSDQIINFNTDACFENIFLVRKITDEIFSQNNIYKT